MCGISGIFSKNEIFNIDDRIEKMNFSLKHRGPDASGVFINKNKIALGHTRLSIIDISDLSNQPMSSDCKNFQIVFNGEIYNFKEIRQYLNYRFKTSSDTEVILASIVENGIDWFLSIANGMFSIAIYNISDQELILIRDRLGIKPLYYYLDDTKIIFSSEIKGILSSGLVEAKFNDLAIDEYLGNRYVRAPYSFFKNIYQVNAGEMLRVDCKINVKKNFFWSLPKEFNNSFNYDEDQIEKKFKDQILKAIKYRLISDVSLGTYLSGGVDSSLITAIAAKEKGPGLNTFTIGFDELNEFPYAKLVSEKYATDHHEILIKEDDYLKKWEELIYFKDSPLGVPNEIPLAIMSEKLKEMITVVLSGEGADELMGGYGKIFRLPFDYDNHKIKSSFYDYFIENYEYVPRIIRDKFLNVSKKYRNEFDSKLKMEFDKNSNEKNVFHFFHKFHVKGLLQRVDMTTMQTSVEARVPFLDHNLIEFSYREIPYDLKLKWNENISLNLIKKLKSFDYSEKFDTPKYLLRKISYNYLPRDVIERKKVGFPVPLNSWFNNIEEMAKDKLRGVNWIKKAKLNDLIDACKTDQRSMQLIWMFINIQMFEKKYFCKKWTW